MSYCCTTKSVVCTTFRLMNTIVWVDLTQNSQNETTQNLLNHKEILCMNFGQSIKHNILILLITLTKLLHLLNVDVLGYQNQKLIVLWRFGLVPNAPTCINCNGPYMTFSYILLHASDVGSPTNHPGSRQRYFVNEVSCTKSHYSVCFS